ncbi:hypothetical protein MJO28_007574 [Puccinia striiformis f. sp. tritici]|uniref:Uncharacterized protein n=1 Tax=Puccinia striiformis f. sp. tritici TaxID=168172 RepID=A0ACC0EFL6_9BASI|nr:hypothetical protein MJO28_007574 [Puccinia striiformis f. sp. tritici]
MRAIGRLINLGGSYSQLAIYQSGKNQLTSLYVPSFLGYLSVSTDSRNFNTDTNTLGGSNNGCISSLNHNQSDYRLRFEEAQSERNIIKILGLCQELKQAGQPSSEELQLSYQHVISILGHYGLWTQLYATVNELMELIGLQEINDLLWATILEAFIQCDRSTDVIYSLMLSTRKDFGPHTMSALFRAAILESNLSQSIFLLQVATTLSLLPKIPKTLLIQLACYLAEQAQLVLAIDLLHSFIIPIKDDDHPDCVVALINLLRICVQRSDPKSTLHCYSYLTNNHGEMIKDLIDDGLMIELLLLSSRHIKADLTLNVLSQLIKFQRKLEIPHLFPSIIALCRAGDRMAEVIQILVRVGQDLQIGSEENEVIGFNLIVGHLGGLHKYRSVMQNNSKEDNGSIEEEEGEQQESDKREEAIKSLNKSKLICRDLLLEKLKDDQQSEEASKILHSLVNSLIKADLELGNPHESLSTFKSYYCQSLNTNHSAPSSFIFNPDHLTLTLLKNIAEQVPQNHHHHQIVHDQILEIINHFQN